MSSPLPLESEERENVGARKNPPPPVCVSVSGSGARGLAPWITLLRGAQGTEGGPRDLTLLLDMMGKGPAWPNFTVGGYR